MNIQDIASAIGGSQELNDAAGQAGIDPSTAQSVVQGALEHFSDGGDANGVADAVAAKTGLDPSLVQQFMPMALGLLQGHAQNGPPAAQGLLGSLLGSL